jgi:hypothetical protein
LSNSQDVVPTLKLIKKYNSNFIVGWDQYKNELREEYNKQHEAISKQSQKSIFNYITSSLGFKFEPRKHKNLVDLIEITAMQQRKEIEYNIEKNKHLFLEMEKQREEAIMKQLEENKKKNLKLADYLQGEGQPDQMKAA